eukprot:934277-Amphidinium_carterae.1
MLSELGNKAAYSVSLSKHANTYGIANAEDFVIRQVMQRTGFPYADMGVEMSYLEFLHARYRYGSRGTWPKLFAPATQEGPEHSVIELKSAKCFASSGINGRGCKFDIVRASF